MSVEDYLLLQLVFTGLKMIGKLAFIVVAVIPWKIAKAIYKCTSNKERTSVHDMEGKVVKDKGLSNPDHNKGKQKTPFAQLVNFGKKRSRNINKRSKEQPNKQPNKQLTAQQSHSVAAHGLSIM